MVYNQKAKYLKFKEQKMDTVPDSCHNLKPGYSLLI